MEGRAMNESQNIDEIRPDSGPGHEDSIGERRSEDRRKQPSEGFTRISIVGWICRRERSRRQEDTFKWD